MKGQLPAAIALLLSTTAIHASEEADVEAVVRKMWARDSTPGIAVCGVRAGEAVYLRGFGHRTLGGRNEIDTDTLFPIGSVSKTFGAASICMLVSSGAVNWGTPVRSLLDGWQIPPGTRLRARAVRDLLGHTVGVERGDHLWAVFDYDADSIVRRLRRLSRSESRYVYSNLNYIAVGEVVKSVSGLEWASFAQRRILSPLGLSGTTHFTEKANNLATEHVWDREGQRLRPLRNANAKIAPAASMWLSIRDMSEWLLLHLGEGKRGAIRLWAAADGREMYRPHVRIDDGMLSGVFSHAALGWFVGEYRGGTLVGSIGATQGAQAYVVFSPECRIGVAVFANSRGYHDYAPLALKIFDVMRGKPAKGNGRVASRRTRRGRAETRSEVTSPVPPMSYVGVYKNHKYGRVAISIEKENLTATFGTRGRLPLRLVRRSAFEVVGSNPIIRIAFGFRSSGVVGRLTIEAAGEDVTFNLHLADTTKLLDRLLAPEED